MDRYMALVVATIAVMVSSTNAAQIQPVHSKSLTYLSAAVNIKSASHYSNNCGFSLQNRTGELSLFWKLDLLKDLLNTDLTLQLIVETLAPSSSSCVSKCWNPVLISPVVVFCGTSEQLYVDYANILGFANSNPIVKCQINKHLYTLENFLPKTVSSNIISGHTKVTFDFAVKGKPLIQFIMELLVK